MAPITQADAERFHAAAKMIEVDGPDAYWSCRNRYGDNVANALLIAWYRRQLNSSPDQYPPPEDLPGKVNEALRLAGLLGG